MQHVELVSFLELLFRISPESIVEAGQNVPGFYQRDSDVIFHLRIPDFQEFFKINFVLLKFWQATNKNPECLTIWKHLALWSRIIRRQIPHQSDHRRQSPGCNWCPKSVWHKRVLRYSMKPTVCNNRSLSESGIFEEQAFSMLSKSVFLMARASCSSWITKFKIN